MKDIIEFLRAMGRLQGLQRTGWLEVGVEKPESVAEHSYRTTILAMVLADLQGLDAEKVMRMALLHDIAEAEMGDITPDQKRSRGSAFEREEEDAMTRILAMLPETLAERYQLIWDEYREAASREAETAVQADKIDMLLRALEYEEKGTDSSRLDRFWDIKVGGGLPSKLAKALIKKRRDRAHAPS